MSRLITMVLLALIIAAPAYPAVVYGSSTCTVKYYYTSSDNPEGVPKPTTGTLGSGKWNIIPAKLSKTAYTKTVGGKTITYTFKGWYTNINCLGKAYAPGVATAALTPSLTGSTYSISLYGKWVRTEKGKNEKQGTVQTSAPAPTHPPASTRSTASTRSAASTRPTTSTRSAAPNSTAALKSVSKQSSKTNQKQSAQSITSLSAYTFPDAGGTRSLEAKASSGLSLKYSSSKPEVVSVDEKGVMKANSAGTATITMTQSGNPEFGPVSKSIRVSIPAFRSREAALAPWKHILIDTFFHINDRRYSLSRPGKYWKDSKGNWSGKTGGNGRTQSCITLPTVSLKRTGLLSSNSGNIWLRSNMASRPNGTVKRLKKNSIRLTITYPHESLKKLAKSGGVRYGDIVCRSGHTFVYMGKDEKGNPLAFDSGTQRNIGNGTRVIWGHHDKITVKVNKQIRASNAQGEKWRKGILTDADFHGHTVSGKNLHKSIHIVCSINTFTVKTSCVNGTITLGNNYMAGQNVRIRYAPSQGRRLASVQVDGKKVSVAKYAAGYTFRNVGANHTIHVIYR